jgi:hypothetical protein
MSHRSFDDSKLGEIQALKRRCLSNAAIGLQFGCSEKTIRNALARAVTPAQSRNIAQPPQPSPPPLNNPDTDVWELALPCGCKIDFCGRKSAADEIERRGGPIKAMLDDPPYAGELDDGAAVCALACPHELVRGVEAALVDHSPASVAGVLRRALAIAEAGGGTVPR